MRSQRQAYCCVAFIKQHWLPWLHVTVFLITANECDVEPMLNQRRRRWSNVKPALDQRIVFTGVVMQCCEIARCEIFSTTLHSMFSDVV